MLIQQVFLNVGRDDLQIHYLAIGESHSFRAWRIPKALTEPFCAELERNGYQQTSTAPLGASPLGLYCYQRVVDERALGDGQTP